MKVIDVVNKQLEYYNNHDIEGFISTYSANIKLYNLGEDKPFLSGLTELRERYTQRFANSLLHANIANRMVIGDRVIDFEQVSGIIENHVSQVVAIYEVKDELIQKVWFARE